MLAVETVGCVQDPVARKTWHDGMAEAMKRLDPTGIVLYVSDIGFDFGDIEVIRISNTNGERMAKTKKGKKE